MGTPVRLDRSQSRSVTSEELLAGMVAAAETCRPDGPAAALELAAHWASVLPWPGGGRTLLLWEALASLAAVDLQVARAVEPHVDALAILAEAGQSPEPGSTWGVYAAEGPGVRLEAAESGDGWLLEGTKPWCSLAAHVSHALVTAWTGDARRLFSVRLDQPGVDVTADTWHARGLAAVTSAPVTFAAVPATPVGETGWYLERDGFAWGGIGVAAVWYGGAVAVARRVRAVASQREPDQIGLWHLGMIDAALTSARAVLAEAAVEVDSGRAGGAAGELLALRVRQVVFDAAESVLRRADHALGPGPLVAEPEHAARVADLHLYLRQHHAERDGAALGGRVVQDESW
jgi:alkylation response protein AidB-like acyl-CoA dehydrogenase